LLRSVTFFSPCSEEELLARVKRHIRSLNEAQSDSILAHAEVALDLLTRRVTAAGIEHDLTTREFTMLEFFLRHPSQVIFGEQLLSRIGLGPLVRLARPIIFFERELFAVSFRGFGCLAVRP